MAAANPTWRTSARSVSFERLLPHVILLTYTVIALFPIVLIIMNSFKSRAGIFGAPFQPPTSDTFSLIGYNTVAARASFQTYFLNSIIVTGVSLLLILLFGSMASFALSQYSFRGHTLLALFLALGIMVPIRLGTVGILHLIVTLNLANTLTALILVYIAQGLPLAIFILTQFYRQVPHELIDAGRIDGASEYRIYSLVTPLVRPAIGAIGIFTMIPIWNDLWFPLILAPNDKTATVTLGTQQFLGQFVSDWNAVLAALTLAMVPILILYLLFSRQLVKSVTAGAIK